MNDFVERRHEAERIAGALEGQTYGVMVVGSVAYNPGAVTPESDLDMVIVMDFRTADWEEIHRQIGVEPNPDLVEHARNGRINNASIIYDTKFEVGLHCWDGSAFGVVTKLDGHNKVFRPDSHDRDFVSLAPTDILRNPKGEETKIEKQPIEVTGGQIMNIFPYYETPEEIYFGIQAINLLLNPDILSNREAYLADGLAEFERVLKTKLGERYERVDLTEALPEKIIPKLSEELEERLRNYI